MCGPTKIKTIRKIYKWVSKLRVTDQNRVIRRNKMFTQLFPLTFIIF